MVLFRLVEKMGLNRMFGNGWLQYFITVILVICGAVIFSCVFQNIQKIAEKKIGVSNK